MKLVILAATYPNLKILLLRRTFPELENNHIKPLKQLLFSTKPKLASYHEGKKTFTFANGSTIVCGYCKHEDDVWQYQGQEYDVILLEEATQFTYDQYIFIKTCMRTTRTDGFESRMYLTCNPGGVGHSWVKRLFIDREYEPNEKPDDYKFIPAKVYDNTVLMEKDPGYVEILMALPEEMRRAHLDGDWDVFAGQYFKSWRRAIHVSPEFDIPEHWPRYRCLDYGFDGTACYWVAVNEEGRCIVYRELWEKDLVLSVAAQKIVAATPAHEKIKYTVASHDLWKRNNETGFTGAEIMYKAGLMNLTKCDPSRIDGWRAMNEFMLPWAQEVAPGVLAQQARMLVFECCKQLITHIPMMQHDPHDPEDCALDPHDVTHGPDAIRYFIMSRAGRAIAPRAKVNDEEDRLRKHREKVARSLKNKSKIKHVRTAI